MLIFVLICSIIYLYHFFNHYPNFWSDLRSNNGLFITAIVLMSILGFSLWYFIVILSCSGGNPYFILLCISLAGIKCFIIIMIVVGFESVYINPIPILIVSIGFAYFLW